MTSNPANATAANVVGWTAGPGARGTLSLIWSCVITIFACTWTVLHLNVPGRHEGSLVTMLRQLKWMAINILFPEFILAKAVCDLRLALEELRQFDENVRQTEKHCKWKVESHFWRHQWVWEFEYPRYAHWLYRLLRLKLPEHLDPEAAMQSRETILLNFQCSQKTGVKSAIQNDVEARAQSAPGPSKTQAASPDPEEVKRAEHDPDVASEQAGQFQTQEGKSPIPLRTVQKWTVVHSYYAQMGGLLYPHSYMRTQSPLDEPSYYCLTASMLTPRYDLWGDQPEDHPFKHLILREKDIKDKSKANWVLKAIAVAQIAWLILSVIVRRILDFPIAQLEIATISFAVIAILSYVANWWKPKDVSHPTILQAFCAGLTRDTNKPSSYTQSFILRLLSPAKAAEDSRSIKDKLQRVPNDFVWMEGESPLLFFLMAISSMFFGGLHCLAWNFEFPTQFELLCWRMASLTSAMLPVITLGMSVALNLLANSYADSRIISTFLRKLQPLGRTCTEHAVWWQLMKEPHFGHLDSETLRLLVRTPAGERNWLQELLTETIEEQRNFEPEDFALRRYREFFRQVQEFREHWEQALSSPDRSRTTALRRSWLRVASSLKWYAEDGTVEFWREYEAFIKGTRGSTISTPDLPNTTCIDAILQLCDEMFEENRRWESLRHLSKHASTFLTIASGVLYTDARLMNIVLMFTCLRRAPADIYRVTTWLELLPIFS